MEFFVYDQDNKKIDVLQNYSSIQWKPSYDSTGTFEIHALETENNVKNMQLGYKLVKQEDNTIGLIEYVYSKDGSLEIRGHLDNLADRINTSTASLRNVPADLYQLVNKNKRDLEITVPESTELSINLELDTTWDDLRTTFSDVCTKTGLGYRMLKKGAVFNCLEVYQGSLRKNVVFSEDIGNMVAQSYLQDMSSYKNVAIVAGEGEGADRIVVEVNRMTEGERRFELYVDAKDLQKTWMDEDGTQHTYTDEQYESQLIQRGQSKLDESRLVDEFTCDIDLTNQTFKYNIDFFLGDIIRVKSRKYNFSKYFRVSSVNEIQEDGYSIKATLTEYRGGVD